MDIKLKRLNKKLITTLLACSLGFTLSGCAKKEKATYSPFGKEYVSIEQQLAEKEELERQAELAEEEYNVDFDEEIEEPIEEPIQIVEEQPQEVAPEQVEQNVEQVEEQEIEENNNEINEEVEVKSEYNIDLVVTNIPENARIVLNDGNVMLLSSFTKVDDYTYRIPSKDFSVSFDSDGQTYTYPVNAENNAKVFIASGINDNNQVQFNIEYNNNMTFDSLKSKLLNANINLGSIVNNNGIAQNIIERRNKTYNGNSLDYERNAISINGVLLNEEVKDYDVINYNSPLRRGNGVNNIELLDNGTVKLTYDQDYVNDYSVIDNIENNINYFFNKVSETNDVNYYTSDNSNIAVLIDEDTKVHEHIERIYSGNELGLKYAYSIDGNTLVEFGQENYDNDYYYNDPTGLIRLNEVEFTYDNEEINNEVDYNYDNNYDQDIYTSVGSDVEENNYNYDEESYDQQIYEYEEDYQFTR